MAAATLAFAHGFADSAYKLIEVDEALLQVCLKRAVRVASRGTRLAC
jgi:hypothetical protein